LNPNSKMSSTHILKFGGTSLQNPEFIKKAVAIVRNRAEQIRPVIVVSAIAGVTDRLLQLTDLPSTAGDRAEESITTLRTQHTEVLGQFTEGPDQQQELVKLFEELESTFYDVDFKATEHSAWRDHILSIGERASALIFSAALSAEKLPAVPINTHHYIKTDNRFGEAGVLKDTTRKLLLERLQHLEEIPVITGFIGSTRSKQITTLGRSGSDYTAGLVADVLKADQLEIWTDVNGVLTADPKIVPDAQNIRQLSFEDISELSAHGAKVIHPKTVDPVKDSNISVYVRNTFDPDHPGTHIHKDYTSNGDFRSITVTGPFVYFDIPDRHALGLARLLEQLTAKDTDPEGFSYSRISRFEPAQFVIRQSLFEEYQTTLESWLDSKSFRPEIVKDLLRVNTFTNQLHAGDEPVANILRLLNKHQLRPLRIHRENRKRYFSLLLTKSEAPKAAQAINNYLTEETPAVEVFLAGVGAVGGTLIDKLLDYSSDKITLRVIGLCNSRKLLYDEKGIKSGNWNSDLKSGLITRWSEIIENLTKRKQHPVIFVDATGSEDVARRYPELLEAGIHIATPSKLANTFEQSFYNRIREKASQNNASFRYETTVGAGLPVISTISDLLSSGDTITELSGVVSGTMTYLFNELENGTSFSNAIVKARELGYAEPDPRDDLSGEDVARKFLTLARETGHSMEREEINVQSLIPKSLEDAGLDEFLDRLKESDEEWKQKFEEAASKGETLRYTGKLKDGKIAIGVERVPQDSPLGQLKGTDNMLRIHSRCYNQTPIIIQGPGAGREVTASGVMADILKIVRETVST